MPANLASTAETASACGPLRVVLHDYGGYAFIAALARELSQRGHAVLHLSSGTLVSGKGRLARGTTDPAGLSFSKITVDGSWDRYQLTDRIRLERAYARELAWTSDRFKPHVVVSANTPLLLLRWLQGHLAARGTPLVNWLQDVHSEAIGAELSRRLPAVDRLSAFALDGLEARLVRSCAAVVAIAPAFADYLERWRVPRERIWVIPNWADMHEPAPRANPFAAEHGLGGRPTVLYAGTLGLKHEPAELLDLAEGLDRARPGAAVVVVSQGLGRDWLEREAAIRGVANLRLVDLQPPDRVPEVLASGDLLLTVLRPEASRYSVPSKVLTYMVAGRAQLASLPADNLAARVLCESGAGRVVAPGDQGALLRAATELLGQPELRAAMGLRGRAYAEEHFDLARIGDRFEDMLRHAVAPTRIRP